MKLDMPSISDQQKFIFEQSTKAAIKQLKDNLKAHVLPGQTEVNEADYNRAHLLDESRYESPHPDIVGAYFRQFMNTFPEYNTDGKLAELLGLSGDRRIRAFKSGEKKVPFNVWRKFLILTGRAPQEVLPVMAFMG